MVKTCEGICSEENELKDDKWNVEGKEEEVRRSLIGSFFDEM